MSLLFSLLLIACGLLAASNWVVAKRPEARSLFDMLAPFAGIMGLGLLVLGVLYLIKYATVRGLVGLATCGLAILLGFLQGFGLVAAMLGGKSPEAVAKAEPLRNKLASVQIPLGIAGVALGVWSLI